MEKVPGSSCFQLQQLQTLPAGATIRNSPGGLAVGSAWLLQFQPLSSEVTVKTVHKCWLWGNSELLQLQALEAAVTAGNRVGCCLGWSFQPLQVPHCLAGMAPGNGVGTLTMEKLTLSLISSFPRRTIEARLLFFSPSVITLPIFQRHYVTETV